MQKVQNVTNQINEILNSSQLKSQEAFAIFISLMKTVLIHHNADKALEKLESLCDEVGIHVEIEYITPPSKESLN